MAEDSKPVISVIILNYNGLVWIEKCLASLQSQTLREPFEIIVADNSSTDGSDALAERLINGISNARFVQNGGNLGYCEGNNRAAAHAHGEYFFFLNNDTWLEPNFLEILLREVRERNAQMACPLVLNYNDDSFQSLGAPCFDIFGLPAARRDIRDFGPVLMPDGSAYLIKADLFKQLRGFDPEFFMYADEYDLSWRGWIAGGRAIRVPTAIVHHRRAANVNPAGGEATVELRTSDTKRYYANRNALLTILKSAQHLLLIVAVLQVLLLFCESLVSLILIRRWSFARRAYWEAVRDCFRMRAHILRERRTLNGMRRRSDWYMLRFLTWRLARWDDLQMIRALGLPKVTAK